MKDPRTVSRDIPGIFDIIFPQLTAGIVAYFNKGAVSYDGINALPSALLATATLEHPMLFEIAYVRAENILRGEDKADWEKCIKVAVQRQRRYFDAILPNSIEDGDVAVADFVGKNLSYIIGQIGKTKISDELVFSPAIPGYQWISSGVGDFSVGKNLIEVKCTGRNFGSADYRQVLMYWLLSYASSIENDQVEWDVATLVNPRLNRVVKITFNEIIDVTSAGKSKVEVLELFASIVGDYALKSLTEFKL